jgi:hypothetical protein
MLSLTDMADIKVTRERLFVAGTISVLYLLLVRSLRFRRARKMESEFNRRSLSTMTLREAHEIFRELRELEFPYTLHSAMKVLLLKVSFLISWYTHYVS